MFCTLFLGLFGFLQAQYFEPFNLRYRLAPQTELTDSDSEIYEDTRRETFQYAEFMAKFPILIGEKKSVILPELIYKISDFDLSGFPEGIPLPDRSRMTRLSVKSSWVLTRQWSLLAFGYASQGQNRGVNWDFDNLVYRYGTGFLYRRKNGHQVGLSLTYVGESDIYFPSLIYKGKSGDKKWSFNIEAPQLSAIEYNLSENSRLRLEQKLDNEKYFFAENSQTEEAFFILNLNFGLGYSYRIAGPLFANVSAGLTAMNNLRLQNEEIETVESLSFGMRPTLLVGVYLSLDPDDFVKE